MFDSPVALAADTKRLHRPLLRGPVERDHLVALLDGLGPGVGDQPLRAVVYDAAGALLASGTEVVIPDGMTKRWVRLPLGADVTLQPGCTLGLQAGGAGSARVWGDGFGQGFLNFAPNPRGATGAIAPWQRRSGTVDQIEIVPAADLSVPHPDGETSFFKHTMQASLPGTSSYYMTQAASAWYFAVTPGELVSFGADSLLMPNHPGAESSIRILFLAADKVTSITTGVTVNRPASKTAWSVVADEGRLVPAGAFWAVVRIGSGPTQLAAGQGQWNTRLRFSHGAVLLPYHDGDQAGCDWTGAQHTSPSIRWQIPEVADTYADGAAATTGLTPAAAKLPAGLALVPPSERRGGRTRLRIAPRRTRLVIQPRRTRLKITPRRTRLRITTRDGA